MYRASLERAEARELACSDGADGRLTLEARAGVRRRPFADVTKSLAQYVPGCLSRSIDNTSPRRSNAPDASVHSAPRRVPGKERITRARCARLGRRA
jgi:hypothetical protein